MRPGLLPILLCPDCGGRLDSSAMEEGTLSEGELQCLAGHTWPVRGGVPRFTGEEYAESFGFQWTHFSRTQLDSANGTSESRDAFVEKTGFALDTLSGKRVLEVGCGMGRFLEVAADAGAEVVGVDISAAVDAAQANLGQRANVSVVQGDVFRLPFAPASFDLIYSIGVLHHTPSTRRAFLRLPGLLKPGGRITIWVYGPLLRLFLVSTLLRPITSRLPKPLLLKMCRVAIPLGRWQKKSRVGPIWNILMPVSQHPHPDWRWLDTFDWYSPRYQHKHSAREVEGWFRSGGLEDVRSLSCPVSVTGRRPAEGGRLP